MNPDLPTPPAGLEPVTVQQALRAAQAQGLATIDAQMLLLHTLGRDRHDRAWLISHDQDALPAPLAAHWAALVQRRAAGGPLAYLTGRKAFYGLELAVDARVLDPRPDTETLVDWALELLAQPPQPPLPTPHAVIDLGTGSGAIALALKSQRPDLQVSALDTSADALAVARANGQRLGLAVDWRLGSWLDGLDAQQRFALIVSNPPYIAEHDPHLPALQHEPTLALTSGPDGLDAIRQIIAQAPAHLHPGGWLLLEHGWDQAEAVRALLTQAGWTQVQSRQDLAGVERCSGGCWAGS